MSWKLSVILLTLSVMACGVQALPTLPESVNKDTHINTQINIPVNTAEVEATTQACGDVWIRSGAGMEFEAVGLAADGDTLYLTGEYQQAKDGGKWMAVIFVGEVRWINARYLC